MQTKKGYTLINIRILFFCLRYPHTEGQKNGNEKMYIIITMVFDHIWSGILVANNDPIHEVLFAHTVLYTHAHLYNFIPF